jgi:hypothetical protein
LKKKASTFLALPLLATHLHRTGTGRQRPFRQRFSLSGHALSRLLAARTTRRLFLRRSHLRIHSDVLFEQEGGQFFAQGTGHVLTLRERHELVLVLIAEHAFECLAGPQQPALAKCFPILATKI